MDPLRSPPLQYGEVQYTSASSEGSSANAWITFTFVILGSLAAVGIFWLAYTCFLKDCILLWKAKKQRRTEEIGFGNTPNQQHG